MAKRRAEPAEHFDYLSMLMNARDKESGDPMTERALIDEVMTLVVAGHETTASGLNWAWYLLARHPEVDARMHAEIQATPAVAARLGDGRWQYTQTISMRRYGQHLRVGCHPAAASRPMFLRLSRWRQLMWPIFPTCFTRIWHGRTGRFPPERFDVCQRSRASPLRLTFFALGPRHRIVNPSLRMPGHSGRHYYWDVSRFSTVNRAKAQINLRATRKPLFMRLERRRCGQILATSSNRSGQPQGVCASAYLEASRTSALFPG